MSAHPNRRLQIVRQHLTPPTTLDASSPITELAASDTWAGQQLQRLAQRVGGADLLESLDAKPHPDEPFDSSGIRAQDRDRVGHVVELIDACCDAHLDTETRTIARRLLARAMAYDPAPLRRCSKDARVAAAVMLAVLDGNDAIGSRRAVRITKASTLRIGDVCAWFRVSSVNELAHGIVRAAAIPRGEDDAYDVWDRRRFRLDDVSLLHSKCRAALIQSRDRLVAAVVQAEHSLARDRPITPLGNGQVKLRGTPAEVVFAEQVQDATGRRQLTLMLCVDGCDDELFFLSIPDARLLQQLIGHALDHAPHLAGS